MWIRVIYAKPRACFWKNFWKVKSHRANLQWCFLSHFSHTVKDCTLFAGWVAVFLLLHYWKKDSLNFVHLVNVGYGKDKNCLYMWNRWLAFQWWATSFILRFGVRSYWALTEYETDSVSTLPSFFLLNLLEPLHSCLGAAVRAWNGTSCFLGRSK